MYLDLEADRPPKYPVCHVFFFAASIASVLISVGRSCAFWVVRVGYVIIPFMGQLQ